MTMREASRRQQMRRPSSWLLLNAVVSALVLPSALALARQKPPLPSRRDVLSHASITAASVGILSSLVPSPASAATTGLADRLAARDPSLLTNRLFNKPPAAQVYPDFMKDAVWDVESKFGGYLFPSQKIPKDILMKQATIPGFQKCSIAGIADIGKEGIVKYGMRIDEKGLEDRAFTLTQEISAFLGYPAIENVVYNVQQNPNRISLDFVDYRTINAERIELFCNGRESQLLAHNEDNDRDVFVCSEYIRQVTFGGGSQVGIPRQVSTNYAHYWTWRTVPGASNERTGNLLTAAYLDAQDPLFFDEPTQPVAVYSHVLKATKRI